MNTTECLIKLKKYNQEHIWKDFDQLSEVQKQALIDQIEGTDFDVIKTLEHKNEVNQEENIEPLEVLKMDDIARYKEQYKAIGEACIKEGKVGAVLFAGGMGTRLGSDHPKGMYNIGLTKDVYIFECLIQNLLQVVRENSTWIHLFIMTSDKNHKETTEFFKEHNYFGYKEEYIHFFQQEMAPATDYNGKVYMEDKGIIANSPNGNGGWFSSMNKQGMLSIVKEAGIEWLNIFAVDNCLQKIADPVFLGATIASERVAGSKVVKKVSPEERVGVMCQLNGTPAVIDYFELPEEMAHLEDACGHRIFDYGVILNYLFKVEDLISIVMNQLPVHIVEKKIPYIDEAGVKHKPTEPNGYKFEVLVTDMIHLLSSCLPFEVEREKEFAPIKNKTGVDSVDTARELLQRNGIEL